MSLITLDKSVLLFLVVFQEMVCLNTKRTRLISKQTGHTALNWAYLHHWYSFRRLWTHSLSKDIVQEHPKYLTILDYTNSIATQINTKNGYVASAPKVVSTYDVAQHVRDVLVESKTSSGIFSLTADAQVSSITKGKPQTVVLPIYIDICISDMEWNLGLWKAFIKQINAVRFNSPILI